MFFFFFLTLSLVFLQEPGDSESSAVSSEGNGRRRVINRPSLPHPLRPAPLPAPPQLRLHLSQILWEKFPSSTDLHALLSKKGQRCQISVRRVSLALCFLYKRRSRGFKAIKPSQPCLSICREERLLLV